MSQLLLQARPFRFLCTTTHLSRERAAAMAHIPVDESMQTSLAVLDADARQNNAAAALPSSDSGKGRPADHPLSQLVQMISRVLSNLAHVALELLKV